MTTIETDTPSPISGIDLSARDETTRPQDDFFQAMNGQWLADFEIPSDKADFASFTALHDTAQEQLRAIIEELSATQPPADTIPGKIATLFNDFMAAENSDAGLERMLEVLEWVDGLRSTEELPSVFGHFDRIGIGAPLGVFVHQDNKDSSRYILDVRQSGLGLPDRDYFLDERFAEQRDAYLAHIATMLRMSSLVPEQVDAEAQAQRIVELETRIAELHWDNVRNRDPQATYNLHTLAGLENLSVQLRWSDYLAALRAGEALDEVTVGQPDYITALGALLDDVPLERWQEYLRFHVVSAFAPLLGPEIDAANFAFYGTTLRGIPEQRPRWKRGVDMVQGSLGEALGQEYVARHFPPENKARMVELVDHLMGAYEESIDGLEWMTPDTKAEAQAKLATFRAKIGYPDLWRDYSNLEIIPGDVVGNVIRANTFEHDRQMAKLGGPIDRDEWLMPPQMVNAYYNPEMNEIVFPAAILQPPFFTMAADDAVNFGAIGAVIGHEISHGFDDKGSQYDGQGNLRNWWTDADHEAFAERTKALVEQYAAYEPVEGHPINGELTLGENIADLSGLAVAMRAYQRSLGGQPAPVIDGLTGEQRFFAGYAQVWRGKTRDEELVRRIATDPHSPAQYRVLGVLVNSDDFVQAFEVGAGDGMWRDPSERVRIW